MASSLSVAKINHFAFWTTSLLTNIKIDDGNKKIWLEDIFQHRKYKTTQTCGSNCIWMIEKREMTIIGNGKWMIIQKKLLNTVNSYKEEITDIMIKEGISSTGE